jgi:predicted aconitase with swiveling domain
MILKGKKIKGGKVEGEPIVSKLPFSYLGDLEVATGRIMVKGHENPVETIQSGDYVKMDADKGKVQVIKKAK